MNRIYFNENGDVVLETPDGKRITYVRYELQKEEWIDNNVLNEN